ncbi:unnamed protein product [Allacma fusca]|uniref:Uncharacterized protein n=1 Tax=Allacma fusca TaxID=39272 RepID=A0A8J2MBX5_9HEXA|nr:unnamed protein product [Allacma fusca]
MARVDSGHETVTSEEEDSPTPRHSPLITPYTVTTDPERSLSSQLPAPSNDRNDSTETCSQCKFTCRRFPITCEKDLYRLTTSCTHKALSHNTPLGNMNRSSSAIVYGQQYRRDQDTFDSLNQSPPKLTGALNSCTKVIIRPIAFKPTDIGNRLHPNYSSMKQSLERRNSENFLRRNTDARGVPELSIPTNQNNNQLNSQRFGGSLCNVLPPKDFYKNNGSTLHIEDVGITPLGKMYDLTPPVPSFDSCQVDEKEKVSLVKGSASNWESQMKHLQAMYDAHLRAAQQRTIKLEQALAAHSCQLQQERRKLRSELDESARVTTVLRQELESRNSQLEEAEWAVCLLKAQLKDYQGDQVTRCHEVVQLRSHVKNLVAEVSSLRSNLSQTSLNSKSMERENITLKQKLMNQDKIQRDFKEENDILRKKLKELELKYSLESSLWEAERAKWSEEQKRVLRYQKALQHNYVITCQKAQDLSYQVESLTSCQRFTQSNPEDHKNGSL